MNVRSAALALFFISGPLLAQQGDLPAALPQPVASPAVELSAGTARPQLAPASLTADQIKQLIQKVSENDIENDKRSRDYTYIEREEDRKLDSNGEVKSTESTTSEVLIIYGSEVERAIAKNDKPLSEKDAKKEDEKIQKIIDKRKNETEEQRNKRLKAEEKEREEGRQWVKEISDAYDFRLIGTEDLNGRATYVIDGTPRPGFQPHLKYANYLSKFKFRVWIDEADAEVSKLDAECIGTVSWGWFIARLEKGAHILFESTRVNDEVWLPKHQAIQLDARLALLESFHINQDTTYRDYKKFRTDARVIGVAGEVQT